jgi:hypothetical protein
MRDRWGLDGTTVVMVLGCAAAFYGFAGGLNELSRGVPSDVTSWAFWAGLGVFLALLAIFLRLGRTDRD